MTRRRADLHFPREILGISSDVFGTVAGVAVAGPILVGFVAGQLQPALVAALMAALAAIIYLLNRLRSARRLVARLRRRDAGYGARLAAALAVNEGVERLYSREHERMRDVVNGVSHVLSDDHAQQPSHPEVVPVDEAPSTWAPDPIDLTTFAITSADFETLYADASARAGAELGPGAVVWLEDVVLYSDLVDLLPNSPRVHFGASSNRSMKHMRIGYHGSITNVVVATLPISKPLDSSFVPVKQWHTDPDYPELVVQSWRRMRKFRGLATLVAYPQPFEGTSSRWLAVYLSLASHDAGDAYFFTLSKGVLRELATPE